VLIDERVVDEIRAALPELPDAKRERFERDYALPAYDAGVLTAEKPLADYFENVAKITKAAPKVAANWVMGDLTGALNRAGLEIGASPVSAATLATLLDKLAAGTISGKIAKEVFEAVWNGEGSVDDVIDKRGLVQISDSGAIDKLVADVIAANPAQVEQYRAGKQQVLGFLVGQVMKASRGKANPQQVNDALRKHLGG
jgi:aspartyl-tRNA(Asn)/glutamyl-tRNA(Gln) amidotransferase subunit B